MVKTKTLDQIKSNYVASVGIAAQRYAVGVQNTSGWQSAAVAGEANYEAKIQAAIANQSRVKGIQKVTDSQWQTAALQKGSQRIAGGMTAGADKQATKFAPYLQAIQSVQLPARTTDGMQNLTQRAGAIVQAMLNARKSIKGY